MTPLESRKQLLLVESELNRAQLLVELRDLQNGIQQLEDQVRALGSLASSAAKVAGTFSAIGSAFTRRETGEKKKSSWISKLFNGARAGAAIWSAMRSQSK